jgi:tRNA U34 2-thiouridine synthase MnmA/TrmU
LDVVGVFMKNWEEKDEGSERVCQSNKDHEDMQYACEKLGISHTTVSNSAIV